MKILFSLFFFLLALNSFSQTFSLFDKTIQSNPQPEQFGNIFNHNNDFYIVTASDNHNFNRKFFYKIDTLGNVLIQKVYFNYDIGSGCEKYNSYLWDDTVFYNLTINTINDEIYLIAFNYNLDTLWKKEIPITDTTFHKYKTTSLSIKKTSNNNLLLLFNVWYYSSNNYTPTVAMIIKTDHDGNFINYHVSTNHGLFGRKTAFTPDSLLLSISYFSSNLFKFDMNANVIDSMLSVSYPDYQTPLSFDILYIGNGKYLFGSILGPITSDPFQFNIYLSLVDYTNWNLVWKKQFSVGYSFAVTRPLIINRLTENKFVISGTSIQPSYAPRGFHFVFNEQGDSLFFRNELYRNQYNSVLNDVIFLDSTHVLGVGSSNFPWIFKKQIDLISTITKAKGVNNSIEIFPNPSTNLIHINPNKNWIDKNVSIEIINSSGKTVLHFTDIMLVNNFSININSLSKGIYFLIIKSKHSRTAKSFIVK